MSGVFLVLFSLVFLVEAGHLAFFIAGFYDPIFNNKDPAVDPKVLGIFKPVANNLENVVFAFHRGGSLEFVVKS